MINKDFFYKKIKEAIQLTSCNLSKETVNLIYEKIYDNYTNDDFDKALFSAMSENNIHYTNLVKWLDYYKELRLEEEAKKQKEEEMKQIRAMLSVDKECKYDYICEICGKTYCNVLSAYSFKVVMSILESKNKLQILEEASKKFPEIFKRVYEKYKNQKQST